MKITKFSIYSPCQAIFFFGSRYHVTEVVKDMCDNWIHVAFFWPGAGVGIYFLIGTWGWVQSREIFNGWVSIFSKQKHFFSLPPPPPPPPPINNDRFLMSKQLIKIPHRLGARNAQATTNIWCCRRLCEGNEFWNSCDKRLLTNVWQIWNKLLSPCYKVDNGNKLAARFSNKTNTGCS